MIDNINSNFVKSCGLCSDSDNMGDIVRSCTPIEYNADIDVADVLFDISSKIMCPNKVFPFNKNGHIYIATHTNNDAAVLRNAVKSVLFAQKELDKF